MLNRSDRRLLAFVDAIRNHGPGSSAEGAAAIFVDWLRDDEQHSWTVDTADVTDLYVNPPPLPVEPPKPLDARLQTWMLQSFPLSLRTPKRWNCLGWLTSAYGTISCNCGLPNVTAFTDIPDGPLAFHYVKLENVAHRNMRPLDHFAMRGAVAFNQCLYCDTLYWGEVGEPPPYNPATDDSLRPLLVKWYELAERDIQWASVYATANLEWMKGPICADALRRHAQHPG